MAFDYSSYLDRAEAIKAVEQLYIVVEKSTSGGHGGYSTNITAHEIRGEQELSNFFLQRKVDMKNYRVFKAEEMHVELHVNLTKK